MEVSHLHLTKHTLIHGSHGSAAFVARVRGDPPLLQSAMDILWRLRFSRLRQAPSRKAWYSRGPVKSKIIASYVHENLYLWYFILPQIMVFPCSINITARLACTNNHTCSTDSLARLVIGFKSTKYSFCSLPVNFHNHPVHGFVANRSRGTGQQDKFRYAFVRRNDTLLQ